MLDNEEVEIGRVTSTDQHEAKFQTSRGTLTCLGGSYCQGNLGFAKVYLELLELLLELLLRLLLELLLLPLLSWLPPAWWRK